MTSNFDDYYYATSCGRPYQRDEQWLAFFRLIAEKIKTGIAPGSVLDAGCAFGFLVEQLRNLDVQAFGVDISSYAIEQTAPAIRPYCWVASLADPLPQRYDLIVSIEVLEHMPSEQAQLAIQNLCTASDDILFSSTPFDYKETTHWNVHVPEYWAEQFAQHSFFRDVNFDASFITPWAVRFRKRSETLPRLIREYEQAFWPMIKENVDLRALAAETQDKLREAIRENQNLHQKQQDLQTQLGKYEERFQTLQNEVENAQAEVSQAHSEAIQIQKENTEIKQSETYKLLRKISRLRHPFSKKQ